MKQSIYGLFIILPGQESLNDDNVVNTNDDDEREIALALNPDLSDLNEEEWETVEWRTPEGKLYYCWNFNLILIW